MIYLFSQIGISLTLAALVGGAIGWLLHRARAGKQIGALQNVVERQQQQVSQAQTEVTILTNDFDELKQHSQSQIAVLKEDNEKIPALNQNLEKSQLLVRQLLQKHEAELKEITSENEDLRAKEKNLVDRENAVTKAQAELRSQSASNDAKANDAKASDVNSSEVRSEETTTAEAQSELPLGTEENVSTASDAPSNDWRSKPVSAIVNGTTNSAVSVSEQSSNTVNPDSGSASRSDTETELEALRDQLAAEAPAGESTNSEEDSTNDSTKRQYMSVEDVEADESIEPIFESVDHHDDLKQIFGIGPVTEKTLNKLGITAYSQLAELKRHDIEKIASALQIFPGRIERDNWVGGARTQLEEVLEDL